jgi:D-galactonate transporter
LSTAAISPEFEKATYDKIAWRLVPFLFLCYIVAFLDRVNVGFAKLQMAPDLKFSDAVYGFGAGIFFIGYFIFEVPSNVILDKVGAKLWIARIMIVWGIISAAFMFVQTEFWFYALRFLLGVAEAGFFPGIILYLTYWFPAPRRAKMTALFMTAIAIANVIGSPISGGIMQYMDGFNGWRGWQWLFLLEGIPSVIVGLLVLALLDNNPKTAKWLTQQERDMVLQRLAEDHQSKEELGRRHSFLDAFKDGRVWALAVVYFCGVVGFYAVNFWMPTIIQELGIAKTDYLKVGLLSMIPWGVAAVVMVLNGQHSDKTGERRWHSAGGLLVAVVGLLALAMIGHAAVASIVALTLVTAGLLAWVATFWSLPTAFLSGTAAAAGIAWINSVGNLGGYFGPDLIGRIRTMSGGATEAAFYTLAAIGLLGALIILFLPKTQTRSVAAPASSR